MSAEHSEPYVKIHVSFAAYNYQIEQEQQDCITLSNEFIINNTLRLGSEDKRGQIKIIIRKLRVFCFTRKIELENYTISIFKLIMPEHYNTILLESIGKKRYIFRWYNWMWKLDKEDETRKYHHQHTRYEPNKISSCNSMDFFFVTLLDYLFGLYEVELSSSLPCKSNYINKS